MQLKMLALAFAVCLGLGMVPDQVWGGERPSGPEVPFPLSLQIPFPWGTIEGVWEAKSSGLNALFSFEVQNDCDNRKILKVFHLDPLSGMVLAEGMGIAIDDKRIVRAAMSSASLGSYMLFIRAFKDPKAMHGPKIATVLTVRPFSGSESDDDHVIVRKISNVPYRQQQGKGIH